jgi:hypothetical protein
LKGPGGLAMGIPGDGSLALASGGWQVGGPSGWILSG